jgi:hypothetical protein
VQGTIDLLVGPHALRVLYSPLRIRLLLDEFDHDEGPMLVGGPEIRRDRRSLVELERPVFESRGTDSGLYDRTVRGVFRGVPLLGAPAFGPFSRTFGGGGCGAFSTPHNP